MSSSATLSKPKIDDNFFLQKCPEKMIYNFSMILPPTKDEIKALSPCIPTAFTLAPFSMRSRTTSSCPVLLNFVVLFISILLSLI